MINFFKKLVKGEEQLHFFGITSSLLVMPSLLEFQGLIDLSWKSAGNADLAAAFGGMVFVFYSLATAVTILILLHKKKWSTVLYTILLYIVFFVILVLGSLSLLSGALM